MQQNVEYENSVRSKSQISGIEWPSFTTILFFHTIPTPSEYDSLSKETHASLEQEQSQIHRIFLTISNNLTKEENCSLFVYETFQFEKHSLSRGASIANAQLLNLE